MPVFLSTYTLESWSLARVLVAQLSRHAVDIGYNIGRQHVIFDQQLNGLRSLSYSSFDSAHIGEQIFQLAQRNSSTLQSLKVSGNAITDVSGLLQNTDSSYVQYPCLHTFQLRGPMDFGESQRPEFPGAVPFPSLWRLDIGYVYPFGDDMVFRGNAATLESLILKPSPGTVRILKEYRVFTPVSHPRLQHVRVLLKPNSEPNIFASDVDYMRFVLSIEPSAPVRTMFDRLNNPGLQSILPVLGEHTCIQVLALGMLHLDLWEAIALVKALPLPSDLYTADPTIVPWPVPTHKLPAHVIANYAPTGNRLRCWHFDINSDNGLKNVVRCVLLLALVCQNFDYADVGIIYISRRLCRL
ncbi:hypothetical protein GGH93_002413 [Coemansia aciculifera]|nr:hypothetical protein GGH93_002413 [Coemansia aciculifera]